MNTTTPWPRSPGCAVPRIGGWPPGTSTGACRSAAKRPTQTAGQDPLAAIRALSALADPKGTALLVLVNFHRFLNSAEIVQALARQITAGKQNRTFLSCSLPVVQIPVELEKLFVVPRARACPAASSCKRSPEGSPTEPGELPEGCRSGSLLDAAAGLTRYEAEGAFSLSIVRHGRLSADVHLGAQVPDAQEERPVAAAPGRRDDSPTWAAWRRSRRFVGATLRPARTGNASARPRGHSCCFSRRAVAKSAFAKAWATKWAGRRSCSTSAP